MKKNMHSIVAVLLLILCVCIIPIAAYAEDESSTPSETSSVPEESSSTPEPPPAPETVTITAQQITGGTITVPTSPVNVGDSFTVTLELASGYDFGTLQYGDQQASGSGKITTTFVAKSRNWSIFMGW